MTDTKWVRWAAVAGVVFFVLILISGPVLLGSGPTLTGQRFQGLLLLREPPIELEGLCRPLGLGHVGRLGVGGRAVLGPSQGRGWTGRPRRRCPRWRHPGHSHAGGGSRRAGNCHSAHPRTWGLWRAGAVHVRSARQRRDGPAHPAPVIAPRGGAGS